MSDDRAVETLDKTIGYTALGLLGIVTLLALIQLARGERE